MVPPNGGHDGGAVLERQGEAPGGRRAHRVVAERAEVRDLAHRHRRHAVLARALDREVDGGDARDLAEPEAAVEAHGGPAVVDGRDHGDGAEVTAAHAPV